MSNHNSGFEILGEIALKLGFQHTKKHTIFPHKRMSNSYFRFLHSISINAALVTSFITDLPKRTNTLQQLQADLSENDYKSLFGMNLKIYDSIKLDNSDCKMLKNAINYYVDVNYNAEKALYKMFLTSILSLFEVYIQDVLYDIFTHYPKTLRSSKTLTFEEIINYSSMDELISYISQIEASKSTEGTAGDYLGRIEKRFGIEVLTKDNINQASTIRNIIVHNNGLVDSVFLRRYPKSNFQEGEYVELTLQDIANISELFRLTTDILEMSLVTEKFQDIAVIEWSEKTDLYLDHVLDLEKFTLSNS